MKRTISVAILSAASISSLLLLSACGGAQSGTEGGLSGIAGSLTGKAREIADKCRLDNPLDLQKKITETPIALSHLKFSQEPATAAGPAQINIFKAMGYVAANFQPENGGHYGISNEYFGSHLSFSQNIERSSNDAVIYTTKLNDDEVTMVMVGSVLVSLELKSSASANRSLGLPENGSLCLTHAELGPAEHQRHSEPAPGPAPGTSHHDEALPTLNISEELKNSVKLEKRAEGWVAVITPSLVTELKSDPFFQSANIGFCKELSELSDLGSIRDRCEASPTKGYCEMYDSLTNTLDFEGAISPTLHFSISIASEIAKLKALNSQLPNLKFKIKEIGTVSLAAKLDLDDLVFHKRRNENYVMPGIRKEKTGYVTNTVSTNEAEQILSVSFQGQFNLSKACPLVDKITSPTGVLNQETVQKIYVIELK